MSDDQWWAADPIATGKGGKPITMPGGASSAKPTEDQAKSASFYSRALGSNDTIGDIVKSEPDAFAPRGLMRQTLHDAMPGVENTLINSPGRQKADAATREFVAATLRRDSGAAISEKEFDDQYKIYFPMPGDGSEVIAQKAQARQRAIDGLRIGAGPLASDAEKSAVSSREPQTPLGEGDIGFGKQQPPEPTKQLSPEDRAAFLELAKTASPEQMQKFMADKGFVLENADILKKSRDSGAGINPNIITKLPKPIDAGDGATGAMMRGIGDTATFGMLDEIGGVVDTLGGTDKRENIWNSRRPLKDILYGNIDQNRAIEAGDDQNHGVARTVGQLAGAVAIPIGAGARSASELAKVGGGLGAAYGFGSGEGGVTDRFPSTIGGAVTGAALGYGAGKLGELVGAKFGNRTPPPSGPTAGQDVAAAADRQGVTVMPADVGSPLVGRMTAGTAQSPYGASRVIDAAKRSVDSLKAARDRIAGSSPSVRDVGEVVAAVDQAGLDRAGSAVRAGRDAIAGSLGAPQDMAGAGQIAQRGAQRFIADSSDRATKLYNKIPIDDGGEAVVSNTRGKLAEMTGGMESNPSLSAMFQNPKFKAYLDALTPEAKTVEGKVLPGGGRAQPTTEQVGGKLSWGDMSEFRTRIGDMLDDPRLSENIAPRQLRALYGAVSADMEATARKNGPEAYKAWRRANDFYDGRQKRIEGPLSLILGARKDATANEAYSQIDRLTRDAAGGDFAKLGQIFRSMPPEDAQALRATLVSRAGDGPDGFSPKEFAKVWGGISDRAKSYLLPQPGQRALMDEAASRAADIQAKTPLTDKSGEAVFQAVERMTMNKGDSRRFQELVGNLSPDDAAALRSRLIQRMGDATEGAQNAEGDAFSPSRFLTRWNEFSPAAKQALFGTGEMRSAMDDLAKVADAMKGAQKYANTSNSGGAISVDKTNGGLAGAVIALVTGHPIIAAGLASPAAMQNISARLLTSQKMVTWLTRAAQARDPQAAAIQIRRLSNIATRDPSIRSEVLQLQQHLMNAVNDNASRAAASGPDQKDQPK